MKSIDIDEADRRILDALQNDASASNQALAERLGISAPTCLRRIRRLREAGWFDSEVAILNLDHVGPLLTVVVEVSLDRQDSAALDGFEHRATQEDSVQQCYRVSPGPDFVMVVMVRDMPSYHALTQRLFTNDANVRNVKAFFSVKRAKFASRVPLPAISSGISSDAASPKS